MKSEMNSLLIAFLIFAISLFATACGDSENITDGDQDNLSDGDTDYDEDIEEDGEIDMDAEPEDEIEDFVYAACADISKNFQFPTPAWEVEADTTSGIKLSIPNNDKAAMLLKTVKKSWYEQLEMLNGFALMGSWFVALSDEANSVDQNKIKIFRKPDCDCEPVEVAANIEVALSEDNKTLMIESITPLPPVNFGERYILALYEGAVSGADVLPACDGSTAHREYVNAANYLVQKSKGANLLLALPFTSESTIHEQKALYVNMTSEGSPIVVDSMNEHDYSNAIENACEGLIESSCNQIKADLADGGDLKNIVADKCYSGIFSVPSYHNENGHFEYNSESEAYIAHGESQPGYFMILPKTGETPFPVVLFQHGGSRHKEDLLTIAKPYIEQGFAMIGVDLPYHGDRETAKGVYDMADLDNPIKSRDNFRQASADHLSILAGIDKINDELDKLTGKTSTLDPAKVFYVGHSMGSLSGTITSSVGDMIKGTNLIAGGASYRVLLSDGMYGLMIISVISRESTLESKILLGFLQTLMDGGDPVNYPVNFEDPAIQPKDVLLWEIMNTAGNTSDPAAINISTELQAKVFGASLVDPGDDHAPAKLAHEIEGMDTETLPINGNFAFDETPELKATRTLTEVDKDIEVTLQHMDIFLDPISHTASAKCFRERLTSNSCTLTLE